MIEVRRDIPVPMSRGDRYGYSSLKVGESVFIEGQKSNGQAAAGARSHGQYHKKKFAVRKEGSGVRIWRVA